MREFATKMKKKTISKVIKNLLELVLLLALIGVIIYLIKSPNGVIGRMNQKSAAEKLDAAINNFVNSEGEKDLEEYLREIEGLEKIEANRETGMIDLTIDGQMFLVVVSGSNPEEIKEGDITVEEVHPEENEMPIHAGASAQL